MSGVIKGINDLKTVFPDRAKEWDYEKNGNLTPDSVAARSNKKVWWNCSKGHSYEASPDHRARGQNCPYCSGKKVLQGYNDLKSTCPALAKDWDFDRNADTLPTMITAGSHKKIWWKCHKCGYSWNTSPNARKNGKRDCPKCANKTRADSHRKTSLKIGKNDLFSQASDIVAEWDYVLNEGKNPSDYTVNSKEKVWWKCSQCGSTWLASIRNRAKNESGCPTCKRHTRTSFPEQAIFFYIQQVYSKAENSYTDFTDNTSMELDVFVPELCVGIEYDGVAWHNNEKAEKRDKKKFELCKQLGIRLIRVSEFSRNENSYCNTFILREGNNSESLNIAILKLLGLLGCSHINVDVDRDRANIMRQYITHIANRSIAVRYPEEVKYWDTEKNKGLTPEMINATSNISYWWKCDLGHSYKAAPCNRLGTGQGCPYCSGKRVLEGFNDLQTKMPDVAEQWDYEKNAPLMPTQFTLGSSKKVWWKCDKGHSYQTTVYNKAIGNTGCPYCANTLVLPGYNDLYTTAPYVIEEWDFEKNKSFTPADVTKYSSKKAWWKCKKGHSWQTNIYVKVCGSGCPICSNHTILPGYNDFLSQNPLLAKEWDYEKNLHVKPNEIASGSLKKVWWKCKKGHSWSATVASRVSNHTGCPYCANQKQKQGYNDLKSLYPDLAAEWNYDKNGDLRPEDVVAGGERRVWWKCAKGHEWEAVISSRVKGRGCPFCSNKKLLPGYNDLATVYPDILSEWDYEKNGDLDPRNISCGSMTKVWWKCSKGHEWYMSPNSRRRPDGSMAQCKFCAGKKAIPGETDLATTRPDLLTEWDYEKNTNIKPTEVKEFSSTVVWWKCVKCGHNWQAPVSRRAGGAGCPKCKGKGASARKRVLKVETNEIYDSIKEASEINNVNRHSISECCLGKRESASGYHWKFV